MNYDDLLWKCQGILSSLDYMRLAGLVAAERELRAQQTQNCETIERQKHAIREAMYLLDQPEPRVHAAFSELLCALNPKLREIQENMDERTNP
jgi:hypothetical protein